MGIPSITLNNYAEHPETASIGSNFLAGEDGEALAEALRLLEKSQWKKSQLPERWDGRTAERIVQTLLEKFE
jgi:UDP-N-acetylglucosamine 2-epimerase (non-hydrolysing)